MKPGKLQRNNSLLWLLRRHVIPSTNYVLREDFLQARPLHYLLRSSDFILSGSARSGARKNIPPVGAD